MVISLWVIVSALTNVTGGISGIMKFIGVGIALLTFAKPKIGLFLICIQVGYLDYLKKLGAYYGLASQQTTIEILAVAALSIGALWATMIVHVFVGRRGIKNHEIVFIGFIIIWAIFNYFTTTSFVGAVQKVINGAGILGVSLAMSIYFEKKEEIIEFVRVVFWILLPWPILGLWQRFVGYTDFEIWYSYTNLSTTNQPVDLWETRKGFRMPIGFGSWKPGYAVVGAMYLFALWHVIEYRKNRAIYFLGFLICFVGILVASSRTALLMPPIILLTYFAIKTKIGGISTLVAGVTVILGMILASDYLLESIPKINSFIAIDGWENTLNVNTFSDRLKSLSVLKEPENWSFFGTESAQDGLLTHSIAADILLQYGVLGLIILSLIAAIAVYVTSKMLYGKYEPEQAKQIRFAISYLFFLVVTGLIGGSSFHTQPGNLVSAAFIGLIVGNLSHKKTRELNAKQKVSESAQELNLIS